MATATLVRSRISVGSFLTRQRLPASDIRIIDPVRETRVALAFAVAYIGAALVTGLIERAWRVPLWGSTLHTSDATYILGFKVGLLLFLPAIAIHRAGYTMDDLLLGWRPTPAAALRIVVLFFAGLLLNASKIGPIRDAVDGLPPVEAALRVGFGSILMLFCAGIPEELVYRWGIQTRLERAWGRIAAVLVTAVLFTAWHLPTRYFLAEGAEGTAGDAGSVLLGTGLPVFSRLAITDVRLHTVIDCRRSHP